MPRRGEYRRRTTPLAGVMGKFPVGSAVLFRGEPVGVVIGYDDGPEEPEVVFLRGDRTRGQFAVRSADYRRAPAREPRARDIDQQQFLAIGSLADLHPSIRLVAGTDASGGRFYSISGEDEAVLHAVLGIERG